MEHQPVERLAQCLGPGEGAEERHLLLGEQRQRGQAGGGADVAEQRKHVVGHELSGVLGAAVGLVAIVQVADLDLPLAHPALGIELVEEQLGTLMELDPELRRRPGEGGRLAEHDAPVPLRPGRLKAGERHGAQPHRKLPAPQYRVVHGEIPVLRKKPGALHPCHRRQAIPWKGTPQARTAEPRTPV